MSFSVYLEYQEQARCCCRALQLFEHRIITPGASASPLTTFRCSVIIHMVKNIEHVDLGKDPMIEPASPKRNKPFVASYTRIADELRARVASGGLVAGQILPGMRRLAKDYGVAVGTVQQAISTLVDEGVLLSDGWRGTFVAERPDEVAPRIAGDEQATLLAPTEPPVSHKTVGIIAEVPYDVNIASRDAANLFVVAIINALERELTLKHGVGVRFRNMFDNTGAKLTAKSVVGSLIDEGVDGIVTVRWADGAEDDELLEIVGQLPFAMASACGAPRAVPFAAYDNVSAGFDAAAHLAASGWRSMVFVAPFAPDVAWQEDRIEGALEAMRRFRVPADLIQVFRSATPCELWGDHSQAGYELAQRLLDVGLVEGRGVIAINDNTAYGFRRAALERGLVAGSDYALIGFDNSYSSLECGLTSLAPPLQSIGEQAARLIDKEVRGIRTLSQIWLRSHLIPRASTQSRLSIDTERQVRTRQPLTTS